MLTRPPSVCGGARRHQGDCPGAELHTPRCMGRHRARLGRAGCTGLAAAAAGPEADQGSYLPPMATEGWTWDDDHNPGLLARERRQAAAPPVSPRLEGLRRRQAAEAAAPPTVITRVPDHLGRATLGNAVLLVDKPRGWTAFDCVKALRSALKVPKAAHTGTLDAQATGLVIVLLGAATSLTARFSGLPKEHSGTIRLGASTTTFDAAGQVQEEAPWQHITDEQLQAAAAGFVGQIEQVPPMWSAAKHHGRPLHWYAERGMSVPRQPQPVFISSFEVWRDPGSRDVSFRAAAGKGAYMRVLAHDFGLALRSRAHLADLRREAIGGFRAANAWDLGVLLPLVRRMAKGARDRAAPAQPQLAPPPP